MNQRVNGKLTAEFEARSQPPLNYSAWLKLFSSEHKDVAEQLAYESEVLNYDLGDTVKIYDTPNLTLQSVCNGHLKGDFYIVCHGQVRLLSHHNPPLKPSSVAVLVEGETFGADHLFCATPLPYKAIAASPQVQVVRIAIATLVPWLEQLPTLKEQLQHHAVQREQLIFFKTLTNLKVVPSRLIHGFLSYLVEVSVPANTLLTTSEPYQSGYFWLRQGEIQSLDHATMLPEVGSGWYYPEPPSTEWIAATDVRLYHLPAEHWSVATALFPHLFTTLLSSSEPNGESLAANTNSPISSQLQTYRQSLLAAKPQRLSRDPLPTPPGSGAELVAPSATEINFPRPKPHRRLRLWHRYPLIEQQSSSDCGVACLAMIGLYWGKRLSLNTLRTLADVGRSGASLKNLAKTAESIGFHARPVRASLSRLVEQKQPWIAHWQGDHYIVVYWVRGDRVLVADPARGKRICSRQEFLSHWTGYALLLEATQELKAVEAKPAQSLWRFWSLLMPYSSVLWQIIGISLLMQVFGLFTPLFTQVILDQVVVQKSQDMLLVFALGLVLFSVWRVGLTGVRQYLLDYFSNRVDLTLVSGFISHTLRLPLKFFESRQVGDILTRIQENQKIQLFLVRHAVSTWLDALMAIVYAGLMFYYNWQLALLVLGLIPPIVLLTLSTTPFLKRLSRGNLD
ncbi:cysteine peptidase family C39 domain-containing protein [Pantanalinema rosaneae CENA516]|uniref:cysteine peptidase family C39 domain-containing protein n=1 Tax=Pantanalinema rosaneae TaxID=1620701 RepID=UPI003D6DCDE9